MADHHDVIASLVRRVSQMDSPFGVKKRGAGLFNENPSGIAELDAPSLFTNEKMEPVPVLEFSDLFAERRLADMQSIRGSGKVQFFGQDDGCV
jgi:hypothetical protein